MRSMWLTYGNSAQGLAVGDSTVASYAGGTQLADLLYNSAEELNGYSCANIAVAGDTIAQQEAAWTAYGSKTVPDFIVVQIGLNDLVPAESAATALGRYQDLIDTINAGKRSDCKVFTSAMIPCKSRLIDLYGAIDGVTSYNKWLAMNTAIIGSGGSAITGFTDYINEHQTTMNDGSGNLLGAYDTGDGIHPNDAGRTVNINSWRKVLNKYGLSL